MDRTLTESVCGDWSEVDPDAARVTACLDGCGDPAYLVCGATTETEARSAIQRFMVEQEGQPMIDAAEYVDDYQIGGMVLWKWVPAPEGHECSKLIARALPNDKGGFVGRWCVCR